MVKKKTIESIPVSPSLEEWKPYTDGTANKLLIKKVNEEERKKLHDKGKIYGWNPVTQEAIIKA